MKKEILDAPIRDSFFDFLGKGEIIVWEGSAIDPKYIIAPIQIKKFQYTRNEKIILFITTLLPIVYFIFHEELAAYGIIVLPLVLFAIVISFFGKKYHNSSIAEFALSTQRILIKSNHSKERVIYEIPFSKLNNCIVEEKNYGRGTIFLALKNPEEVQFETFTITENGEIEKRHQPTLENIKNPQAVAKLIREGIQNTNSLS